MKIKNPTLSIVVPIYNVGNYLEKCVESLINQTNKDYEIILVNDGSTDNSLEICNKYINIKYIKLINKNNGGLVNARKCGAKIAKGKYISCVDGDDWVSNNFVEEIIKGIKEYDSDVICFNYFEVKEGKEHLINKYNFRNLDRNQIEKEIFCNLIQGKDASYFKPNLWGKAFKIELYRKAQNKIDDSIKIGEDGACTIPIIYRSKSILFLDKCLYFYRINNSSMTRSKNVFDPYGPMKVSISIANNININDFDFYEQLYRKIVHDLFSTVLTQFNKEKKYKEIKKEIKDIISNEFYKNAIDKCTFDGSIAAKLIKFSMKYKLIFVIYIWYLLKYR